MKHSDKQRIATDHSFKNGSRSHVNNKSIAVDYIVTWRIIESFQRLASASKNINFDSKILVLCAAEGYEGSILADIGYKDIIVSDISEVALNAAINRDDRIKAQVFNTERLSIKDNSVDVVLIQDGLHHLQSPIGGFTEMLRVAKHGVVFLEPHESLIGSLIGTQWEVNGDAINYVFRWNKKLVEDVSSSYLGPGSFVNLSFSFWHHNIVYAKLAAVLGNDRLAQLSIKILKKLLDTLAGNMGNSFCGLILKE